MLARERAATRGIAALVVCLLTASGDSVAQQPHASPSPVVIRSMIGAGSYAAAEAEARLLVSAVFAESGTQSLQAAAAIDLRLPPAPVNLANRPRG